MKLLGPKVKFYRGSRAEVSLPKKRRNYFTGKVTKLHLTRSLKIAMSMIRLKGKKSTKFHLAKHGKTTNATASKTAVQESTA